MGTTGRPPEASLSPRVSLAPSGIAMVQCGNTISGKCPEKVFRGLSQAGRRPGARRGSPLRRRAGITLVSASIAFERDLAPGDDIPVHLGFLLHECVELLAEQWIDDSAGRDDLLLVLRCRKRPGQ